MEGSLRDWPPGEHLILIPCRNCSGPSDWRSLSVAGLMGIPSWVLMTSAISEQHSLRAVVAEPSDKGPWSDTVRDTLGSSSQVTVYQNQHGRLPLKNTILAQFLSASVLAVPGCPPWTFPLFPPRTGASEHTPSWLLQIDHLSASISTSHHSHQPSNPPPSLNLSPPSAAQILPQAFWIPCPCLLPKQLLFFLPLIPATQGLSPCQDSLWAVFQIESPGYTDLAGSPDHTDRREGSL